MKRILAGVLAALMLLPLAACAGDSTDTTDTTAASAEAATTPAPETAPTHDADGYLLDGIPDDLDYDGATVNFLYWSDATMPEFFVEDLTGDIVGDSIFKRNEIVEERLGVKLEYVGTKGNSSNRDAYVAAARNAVNTQEGIYDIFASYSMAGAMLAMNGLTQDLYQYDVLDFSKPWWPKRLTEEFTVGDRLFFASGDISTNLLYMMMATYVNRGMIEDLGVKDPYDLVLEGKWTLETMFEYCAGQYQDLNNDGKKGLEDKFGIVVYDPCIDTFFGGCDMITIIHDAEGNLAINPEFAGDKTHDFIVKMANAFNHTDDWYTQNSTKLRPIFAEERALFITDRAFIAETVLRSTSVNYGIVPAPKYDEAQEEYVTTLGHPYTMYSIAADSKDGARAAAVLECLGSEAYRRVTPAIFEQTMKLKYAADNVTAQMYDTIRNGVSFDLGRVFSAVLNNIPIHLYKKSITGDNTNWASTYAAQKPVLEKLLEKVDTTLRSVGQ